MQWVSLDYDEQPYAAITYQHNHSERQRTRPQYKSDRNGGDLISHSSSNRGRLTDDYDDGATFSIKGAAPGISRSDFSILGASAGQAREGTNGSGNDLFANRPPRSGQRLGRS
jgi:hypothetical protein